MLIILPPSETQSGTPPTGQPLDLDRLAFPALNPLREHVIRALIKTSAAPDALARLLVRPRLIGDVLANTTLRESPTQAAWRLFAGPLYRGLDPASLSKEAIKRTDRTVVIASSLFGAIRPTDPVPAYRLSICARLIGMERLEPTWRAVLPPVLKHAVGRRGVVLDLRSPAYRAVGSPTGMADRTVMLRVLPLPGKRTIGDVDAKRTRGTVARQLLELGIEPSGPDELVAALAQWWPVRLESAPAGGPWTVALRPSD